MFLKKTERSVNWGAAEISDIYFETQPNKPKLSLGIDIARG